jgi:hypothetical protein
MTNYYQFQQCFKKHDKREDTGKGQAYKECVGLNKGINKVIKGPFLKDGKPKHNLYNLEENEIIAHKIQNLLEQGK